MPVYWCGISRHKQHIFHAPIWFLLQLLSKCAKYQVKKTCTVDRIKSRKTINTNFKIIVKIFEKQLFDIIARTPRGALGLCCVHITQLMTHLAVYTLPFTLQLCYKPLGLCQERVTKRVWQRVSKSQKVHVSSHDVLKKLHNTDFACHRSQVFSQLLYEKQETPPSRTNFLENNQKTFSWNLGVYAPY